MQRKREARRESGGGATAVRSTTQGRLYDVSIAVVSAQSS
jgi:hypothetical protein